LSISAEWFDTQLLNSGTSMVITQHRHQHGWQMPHNLSFGAAEHERITDLIGKRQPPVELMRW